MNVYAAADSLSRLVACSRLVGQPFCDALVQSIAETLNVPTVLIARISSDRPGSVCTVSAWSNGTLVPNFEYDLTGSPCQQVMADSTCHYSDGVAELFPEDRLLVEMGARSYMGTPLLNSEGRAVGVLAAISDAPLEVGPEARALFEIFAGRVAAELDRESSVSRSEYLGRLINGSESEIYVFDADTLRFVLVNEGARANLGYSIDELETMTPLDLKPDFTIDEFLSILDPLHSGQEKVVSFRTRHLRKDGSFYAVAVRLQKISDLGTPVFYAAIEDITERIAVRTQLDEARKRLERLFSQSPAGIVEADSDGRIRLVNPAWCEMLGYEASELIGMSVVDVTEPASLPQTLSAFEELSAGRQSVTVEKNYIRKDGTTLSAISNVSALRGEDGTFLGIAAIVSDVTERLRAEERLRDSEIRLRKILDGTLAFVGVLQPDGTLLEANAAAIKAAGLSRDDVIGRKFWDCEWWSYSPSVISRLQQAVERAATGTVVRYDETIRVENDARMVIDFMITPYISEDGSVELLVPSAVDITERKKQEAMLHELMREVNHRSKNLLSVVQAIARQMPEASPQLFKRDLGKRLQSLAACQDMLVNSGWQSVSISSLLQSQLAHFGDLIGSRIHLSGPDLHVSPAAAQAFSMAVYELTTNATKYGALSNDSGIVEVNWTIVEEGESGHFALAWRERGGPAVSVPTHTGFGSKVLTQLVSGLLKGTSSSLFEPEGLVWRVESGLEALSQRIESDASLSI